MRRYRNFSECVWSLPLTPTIICSELGELGYRATLTIRNGHSEFSVTGGEKRSKKLAKEDACKVCILAGHFDLSDVWIAGEQISSFIANESPAYHSQPISPQPTIPQQTSPRLFNPLKNLFAGLPVVQSKPVEPTRQTTPLPIARSWATKHPKETPVTNSNYSKLGRGNKMLRMAAQQQVLRPSSSSEDDEPVMMNFHELTEQQKTDFFKTFVKAPNERVVVAAETPLKCIVGRHSSIHPVTIPETPMARSVESPTATTFPVKRKLKLI